jgi:hypothetical protein
VRKISILLLIAILATGIFGCTTVKKMTGATDDTILPGQREDILPPEAQTAKDPAVTGKTTKPPAAAAKQANGCAPDDLNCVAPFDQESSTPQ